MVTSAPNVAAASNISNISTLIYKTRGTYYDLYRINVNQTGNTQITNDTRNYFPSITADGTKVLCARGVCSYTDIIISNSDGSSEVNLTNTNDLSETFAAISEDGTKIVYILAHNAWIMDWDGSNKTEVGPGGQLRITCVWFSPDNTKIVFSCYNQSEVRHEIHIMDSDGSNLTLLKAAASSEVDLGNLRLYSAINKIFYDMQENGNNDICSINIDGSEDTNITNTDSVNEMFNDYYWD